MKLGRLVALAGVLSLAAALAPLPASATHGVDTEVSVGSNDTLFTQDKQNEPALAVDANHPTLLVGGANDEIDVEGCNVAADNTCPFTQGVGTSGVYFSFDRGDSWDQPTTYTGYSARDCIGVAGTSTDTCDPGVSGGGHIGTLPWYGEDGVFSDGDPAVAFGPKPDSNGNFDWDNGSRLYYANLTSNFSTKRTDAGFKGVESIGVSRLDVPSGGISSVPAKSAWKHPKIITAGGSASGFADKEQVWADNATHSPFFGNAYVCFGDYAGGHGNSANVREVFARSTDGGATWQTQIVHKNTSASSGAVQSLISGTSGCTIRTDSDGNVYLFWVGYDSQTKLQGIYLDRSFDGGATFEGAHKLFTVHHTGVFDPVQGRFVMDGDAGARDDLSVAPSVDIANNSPSGASATNQIVLAWVDGGAGLNHEHLKFTTSTDGGDTWSARRNIEVSGDRPYYTAPAISPDGQDVYVVYDAFTEPYQNDTSTPRPLIGVLLHADVNTTTGVVGSFSEIAGSRSNPGDARAASANALTDEFLGDYVYAIARNGYGAAVWNDTRDGADCPAIDEWRQSLQDGVKGVARPAPNVDCTPDGSKVFGNSSIYGVSVADPT